MPKCSVCKQTLPPSAFHRNRNSSNGFRHECQKCDEKRRPNRVRNLWRRYRITVERYEEMLKEQNGRCGICNKKGKLHVDHCHTTGAVRGLLCLRCNLTLGTLEAADIPLDRLTAYLNNKV